MGPSQVPIIEPKGFCVRGVGIVTAMRMEARCLTRGRLPFNRGISLGQSGSIWLCGMGEKAARQAAEGLKEGGATALMSFGFAGALDPNLRPGDLVLPETIHAGYSMPVDLGWRSRLRLREGWPACGEDAHGRTYV